MPRQILFAVLTCLLALVIVCAPLLGATGHATAYLVLHSLFSHVCHQELRRSFIVDGFAFPVCARCLGIYLGAAGGALLSLGRPWHARVPVQVLWITLLINGLDVATEMMHLHGNMPVLRLLLGLGFGLAAALLVACGPAEHKHCLESGL